MAKRNLFYELIIPPNNKAIIKNKITGDEKEFEFDGKAVWKIKKILENEGLVDISWDKMVFTDKKNEILNDYDGLYEPYDNKNKIVKIGKTDEKLTAESRAYILRHEHTTGRWGQNIADAEINSTKDYVILNSYDHDIDYMFSESVNSKFWIYNLNTMEEFVVEGISLNYNYHNYSGGRSEDGVYNVNFSKDDPYKIIITFADGVGGKGDKREIELPK